MTTLQTMNKQSTEHEEKPTYERPQVVELGGVHEGEGSVQFCENGSVNVFGCNDGGDGTST